MKKLHLKARFNGENNSSSLIRAFFHDFKSGSSIDIKDGKVQMKVICDDVPEEVIEAITYFCEVDEFHYGESSDDCTEDESDDPDEAAEEDASEEPEDTAAEDDSDEPEDMTADDASEESENMAAEDASEESENMAAEEDASEEPEDTAAEEDASDETEDTAAEDDTSGDHHDRIKISEIPELEDFAKKAKSFGDFAYLVAEWLDQGTRCDMFVCLAYAATRVDKVSWKSLSDSVLRDNRINITESHKNMMAMKASKKLKEYSLTMIPLLRIVSQYKDYPFEDGKTAETANTTEASDVYEKSEELSETDPPKARVKMDCMPEIPEFEEVLGCIDKTQPIEYKLGKVLSSMAGDNGIQHEVYVIANTAVRLKDINSDSVKSNAGLSENLQAAWMTISKFVNDFAARYGSSQKIKVSDFLKDLQKVVLSESEIANL